MTGPTLTLEGVTKQFGRVRAVDDLSFTVRPGVVTGFLGPNGSGKTTTLRMLLGLAEPTSGRGLVGDRPYAEHPQPARLVGSSLDPGFHPGRTGLAHLETYAPQVGAGRARCREVLELVGMGDFGDRRVGAYSMGMKQRLGLATALLADPPAVVLDEPANGLDPEGIVWLRGLLRRFAEEGRTVLVSSHVLTEVQHTVDEVVVIARGRLVHASSLAELAASAESGTLVVAADPAGLARLVADRGWTAEPEGAGLLVRGIPAAEAGAACFAAGLELHQLATRTEDLEAAFLRLTAVPEVAA
ncbi:MULTISPECIES: ABC transporter ATP-binding protein [unclassified Nocardioides]|uniref:ABC transporter ATP-binding protein n=1 Tax=unclassified Nocardioides TaxID=2615069 RepID=UPI003014D9FB